MSAVSRRTVSPVASELAARALGERLGADAAEALVRGAQQLARVGAPVLAPQPLAVDEPAARELDAPRGCARAARSTRGSSASSSLTSARQRASTPSAHSVPLACVRSLRRSSAAAASSGRPQRTRGLDQLDQGPPVRHRRPRARTPAARPRAPRRSGRGRCAAARSSHSSMPDPRALAARHPVLPRGRRTSAARAPHRRAPRPACIAAYLSGGRPVACVIASTSSISAAAVANAPAWTSSAAR